MKSEYNGRLVREAELTEVVTTRVSEDVKRRVTDEAWRRSSRDRRVSEAEIVREALRDFLELDEE